MAIAILNLKDIAGIRVLRVCGSKTGAFHSYAWLQEALNKTKTPRQLAIAKLKVIRHRGQLVPREEIEEIIHQEK